MIKIKIQGLSSRYQINANIDNNPLYYRMTQIKRTVKDKYKQKSKVNNIKKSTYRRLIHDTTAHALLLKAPYKSLGSTRDEIK